MLHMPLYIVLWCFVYRGSCKQMRLQKLKSLIPHIRKRRSTMRAFTACNSCDKICVLVQGLNVLAAKQVPFGRISCPIMVRALSLGSMRGAVQGDKHENSSPKSNSFMQQRRQHGVILVSRPVMLHF